VLETEIERQTIKIRKRGRKTQEVAIMVEKHFLGYGYLSRAESKRMKQTEEQVKKERENIIEND